MNINVSRISFPNSSAISFEPACSAFRRRMGRHSKRSKKARLKCTEIQWLVPPHISCPPVSCVLAGHLGYKLLPRVEAPGDQTSLLRAALLQNTGCVISEAAITLCWPGKRRKITASVVSTVVTSPIDQTKYFAFLTPIWKSLKGSSL